MNKFFIIDAYALIYRAYYAFINNPRYNSKGQNTSAIFGFVNYIDEILKKENPTHIAVCFDPPQPSFRKQLYSDYKANRLKTPEDIKMSVSYIKDILKAFNISFLEIENYEADDVAGSLAKKFSNETINIFLYTSDKDYLQLIDNNISVFKPKGKSNEHQVIDLNSFKQIYNLSSPSQFIDILALMGDASDNVPGVDGIGEKKAFELVIKYNSLEFLMKNLHTLTPKLKQSLEINRSIAFLSKELVTIKTDIELNYDLSDFEIKKPDYDALHKIFEQLEFKKTTDRVLKKDEVENTSLKTEDFKSNLLSIENSNKLYYLIENISEANSIIDEILKHKSFAFDTETDNLDPINAKLVGFSICTTNNVAYYFPYNKDILEKFIEIFNNSELLLIGQNIKFDLLVLKKYDIMVKNKLFDTLIAHSILEPNLKHNLDYLSEIYLNYKTIHIDELIGKKNSNQLSMSDLNPRDIYKYACEDADVAFQLKSIFCERLKNENIMNFFEKIEMPLIPVLTSMEYKGVKIDCNILSSLSVELNNRLQCIENKIFNLAGEKFNISSGKQLGAILFEKLKISDKPKLTKTKQYTTDEEELSKYVGANPIIEEILEFKKVNKLINTYVESLPKLVNSNTKRIHTSFNQFVTITGRLSSNNPNLQNIPIRSEEGIKIRESFIPDEGFIFIDADYSQIELRIMAHLSQDENMLAAFNNNLDIHSQTASKIYQVPIEQVTKEMRYKAKSANFAMIYGSSSFGLSRNLKISLSEAKFLLDNYFSTYPGVKVFMEKQIKFARDNEYVTTLFGRKRYLPEINSKNSLIRVNAEHNAINTPIQGTASDIIKIAMSNLYEKLKIVQSKTNIILQVHDELLIECPINDVEQVSQIVKNEMQNAVKLSVPVIVDLKNGFSWADAH